jgi:hypothetical protein
MTYQFFRMFKGPSTEVYVMSLYPDRTTGLLAHLKTLSTTASKYEARVMYMQYNTPGGVLWSQYLFQATYMHSPINTGSLATDQTGFHLYAYSCLVMTGTVT